MACDRTAFRDLPPPATIKADYLKAKDVYITTKKRSMIYMTKMDLKGL